MPSSPKEQDYVHTRQYSTVGSNSDLKKKTAKLSSAVLSKLFACGQRQSPTFKGWKIGNRESILGKRNFLLTDCLKKKQPAVGFQKQVFSSFDGECYYLWDYSLRKTLVSLLLFSIAFSIQSVSAQNSNRNIANSAKKQIGQSTAKSAPFIYDKLQQHQLGNTKKLELNLDSHQNQEEIFGSGVLTGGVKSSYDWFLT